MQCPRCQTFATEGSKFCAECGLKLPAGCPVCGAAAEPGSATCAACAPANIAAAALAQVRKVAERRQMTVLFYDMVGSTALADRCDPEDFSEAIDRFHAAARVAVEEYGGFVGAKAGDGAIVYFGYPSAHEDAAERAVRAGLGLAEVVAGIELPDGTAPRVRVGIATGQGVVTDTAEGLGNEVVGSVAHLAARLQSAAPAGGVLIAQSTRRLVGELFKLEDMGCLEVRGFDEPVQAWRVLAAASADRFAALRATRAAPLIGREEELARLRAAWDESRSGDPRAVLLIGEPGVGKSRIAADFLAGIDVPQLLRVKLFFAPHSQNTPLKASIENLRRHRPPPGGRFVDALAPGTSEEEGLLLARLAGVPAASSPAIDRMAPAQVLDRTIDALIRQSALAAAGRPACILIEDVHWADPTSLVMIERGLRDRSFGPALVILTSRPEFQPGWLREAGVETIALAPLGAPDGAALVEHIAGTTLSPRVRAAILQRGDGVPLFLEELTRAVVEARRDAANDESTGAEIDLPTTLQDSLLARLDRLGAAKLVAQAGAVIGREFSRALVASVLDQPVAALEPALDRLAASGLVAAQRSAEGEVFQFKHVLVQETAYGTLLRADRRRLNGRLLAALEGPYAGTAAAEPERMAQYAAEAGERETAAGYWLKAGVQALLQSAMPEAIGRLRRGLAAVSELPHGPARWRPELELELALGKALIATQGYAAASTGATYMRAKALCDALPGRPHFVSVVYGLWIHDFICGRLAGAAARVEELLGLAAEQDDRLWTMIGHRARGVLAYPQGDFVASLASLERALELYEPERRAEYARILVDDARVVTRVYASWLLAHLGRPGEARAACAAAVADARALDHPLSLAHALNGQLLVSCWLGEFDEFEAVHAELIELTRANGIVFFTSTADIEYARYLTCIGRYRDACAGFERAIRAYRATESVIYLTTFMTWHADALRLDGRIAEAAGVIGEVQALERETGMRNETANTLRVLGDIRRAEGDIEAARDAYAAACRLAEAQSSPLFLAPAEARLADLAPPRRRVVNA